jgi:hypothetical protein
MRRTSWPKGSPIWHCHCTTEGNRFRVSLGTDDRKTAEIGSAEILALLRALPAHLAMPLFLGMSVDEISRLTWSDVWGATEIGKSPE